MPRLAWSRPRSSSRRPPSGLPSLGS
jgi:hypothetical protein